MGMTPRQLLWLVELPLAMPSIIAGVRVATVIGVGTATIAAAIGAGGLGEYIFRGLVDGRHDDDPGRRVPAAALALAADGLLAWVERGVRTGQVTHRACSPASPAAVAVVILAVGARRLRAVDGGRPWSSARRTSPSR